MKIGDLRDNICGDDDFGDYEIILMLPEHRYDDQEYEITEVRWQHQSHEVVIEIGEVG